jgi:large subunit ribosomal protein L9
VTNADVAAAIRSAGGPTLDKRVIELTGHIKTLGKHSVTIRLHPEVKIVVTVQVTGAG